MSSTTECPACSGLVSTAAAACPHCGHPMTETKAAEPVTVVGTGPEPQKAEAEKSYKFLWFVGLLLVLGFCMYDGEDKKPAPVVRHSNVTYDDIEAAHRTKTDLQFEDYAKTLEGVRVDWAGTVVDVKEKSFGGFKILVDQDNTGVQDVYLMTDGTKARSLGRGQRIEYTGTISSVIEVLGLVSVNMTDVVIR